MAKLNFTSLSLEVGGKKALNLTGSVGTIKWSSKNTKIATVTSKGVVTGVSVGKTTITATNQKKNYICNVEIKKGNAKLNLNNVAIKVGETIKLKVLNTSITPVWSSSDKKIATCKNGTVKGIKSGACLITATVAKETFICAVEVGEAPSTGAVDKKLDLSHSSLIVDDKGTIDPFAVRQLKPDVSYIYKKNDKLKEVNVKNRLENVQYSEAADGQADMITATLDNIDGKFYDDYFPELGYAMNFKLQYQNWDPTQYASKALSIDYGQFVIDEVKYTGYPSTVEIGATSKPRETSFDTTLRSETYKNKTIEEIAKKICSDKKDKDGKERNYNLTVIYNAKKVTVNKTQDNQTDSEFLKGLADDYGLCMKISNRRLILYSLRKAETSEIKAVFDFDGVDETKDYKSEKPAKDVEPGWVYNNSLTGMYDGCAIRFTAGDSGKSWLRIVYLNDLDKNISDINNIVAIQKETNSDTETTSSTTDLGFKTYSLSDSQIRKITSLCIQEQGSSKTGIMWEASQMCNLWESKSSTVKKKYDNSIYKYIRNGTWYAGAAEFMDQEKGSATQRGYVKEVMCNGLRRLPLCVDEHDCVSDLESVPSNPVRGKTVIKNTHGSTYTYFGRPTSGGDFFGAIHYKSGQKYYTIDGKVTKN